MNRQLFLTLLALTAVVVGVALWVGRTGTEQAQADNVLLPSFRQHVNDVSRVRVARGEVVAVSLERGESGWTVAELDHYPADWPGLRELLADLADARIVEYKTDNPEYYGRLGVADAPSGDGDGQVLIMEAGDQSWRLVIGDRPSLQDGQYVRVADEPRVLLLDREIDVSDEPVDWVAEDVLDIPPAEVASLEIRHDDGELVRISKVSADDADYVLETRPEGRELSSSYMVNAAAGVFSGLRMDDVRRDDEDPDAFRVAIEALLFDGTRVQAQVIGDDDDRWLRLLAVAPDVVTGAGNQAPDDAEAPEQAEQPENVAERAENINGRVQGWLYKLSPTRMDNLVRRNDAFLKEVEED